jgi:hypothetical protein
MNQHWLILPVSSLHFFEPSSFCNQGRNDVLKLGFSISSSTFFLMVLCKIFKASFEGFFWNCSIFLPFGVGGLQWYNFRVYVKKSYLLIPAVAPWFFCLLNGPKTCHTLSTCTITDIIRIHHIVFGLRHFLLRRDFEYRASVINSASLNSGRQLLGFISSSLELFTSETSTWIGCVLCLFLLLMKLQNLFSASIRWVDSLLSPRSSLDLSVFYRFIDR